MYEQWLGGGGSDCYCVCPISDLCSICDMLAVNLFVSLFSRWEIYFSYGKFHDHSMQLQNSLASKHWAQKCGKTSRQTNRRKEKQRKRKKKKKHKKTKERRKWLPGSVFNTDLGWNLRLKFWFSPQNAMNGHKPAFNNVTLTAKSSPAVRSSCGVTLFNKNV